jgi:LysR family hydrogen peroxide-inducible transcriptional activator
MDVRQLSALVAIADHGTFSAAARALFTVQSNVSGHISRLERELGVTLVDRSGGGLTDEGARVVERARRILNEIDDISADMTSRHAAVSGQTRIGVIGTTARWLLPQLLRTVRDQHPGLRAIVHEGATSTLVPNVLGGQLNGAVVHLPVDDPELVVEPLFAEDLFLLADRSHPLAERTSIDFRDLDDVPLLLPPTGAPLRRVLDRAAAAAGISLRADAEVDGVRLLASLAFDGYGAAIVPATAAPMWLQGSFTRVTVHDLPRRVVAFVHRRRPRPTAPTLATLDALRTIIAEHGDEQAGVHPNAAAITRGKATATSATAP